MNADDRRPVPDRRRLLDATRQAAAAARHARGQATGPPRPGDLYVLDDGGDHGVEWMLTAPHPRQPGRVRLVAADTAPWVGSADLEVPAEEPAAPLVLRCRHRLWWDGRDLPAERRTGRLGEAVAAAAEARCRALEDVGAAAPTPLERETEDEPDYRDRDEELAAARAALAARAAEREHRRQAERFGGGVFASVPLLRAAAAVLLLALAATAWWGREQARRAEELERPRLTPVTTSLNLSPQRGDASELAYAGDVQVLRLATDPLDDGTYRLEILDGDGAVRFQDTFEGDGRDLVLSWRQRDLPPGDYAIRVLDLGTDPPELRVEHPLRLLAAPP